MRLFGKNKTEPEARKSEVIKAKLAEIAAQIEGAEGDLRNVSLDAALSENADAGFDAIAKLRDLRGKRELLEHALVQAEQLEADERDAAKLVEHKARRRSASQHAGALERAAKQVSQAQAQLIDAYGKMVSAAGSLVAVVPAHMRTEQEPWQLILSEAELRRMVKIEGHRINREAAGPELFGRTGTGTGAVEATTDGYTIPTLAERVAQLCARLKDNFDKATPGAVQAEPVKQEKEQVEVSGEIAAVDPLPSPVSSPIPNVDQGLGFVNLRGKDLGVKKEPEPEKTWLDDFPTGTQAQVGVSNA